MNFKLKNGWRALACWAVPALLLLLAALLTSLQPRRWSHLLPVGVMQAFPGPAPIPQYAFFITTPQEVEKDQYSLAELNRTLLGTGVISNLHFIDGTYKGQHGCVLCGNRCDPGGCQIGLSLAHLAAWEAVVERNLSAAWVFENDVIFHQDFTVLFPEYWQQVPSDFEILWLGFHPFGGDSAHCESDNPALVQRQQIVWTTHAMIISNKGAERLARAMRNIIGVSHDGNRSLTYQEIKIDFFTWYVYRAFLTDAERRKWVTFQPTKRYPSRWGGHEWCRVPNHGIFYNGTCTCEGCDPKDYPGSIPVLGTGLVYQNNCKGNRTELDKWKVMIG